jgi:hypothetical protein
VEGLSCGTAIIKEGENSRGDGAAREKRKEQWDSHSRTQGQKGYHGVDHAELELLGAGAAISDIRMWGRCDIGEQCQDRGLEKHHQM